MKTTHHRLGTHFSPRGNSAPRERAPLGREVVPETTHIGARAYCEECGHEFSLTAKDKPIWHNVKGFIEIPCPACGKTVRTKPVPKHSLGSDGNSTMINAHEHHGQHPAPHRLKNVAKHPTHVGVSGYCDQCGKTFVLTAADEVHQTTQEGSDDLPKYIFIVSCPHNCGNEEAYAETLIESKRKV